MTRQDGEIAVVVTTLRIPVDLHEKLKAMTAREHMPLSVLMLRSLWATASQEPCKACGDRS